MTLIASFNWGGIPILVGDIMLSSQSATQGLDELPTALNLPATSLGSSAGHVVGAAQKIFIPHPHVALAWAGSALKARIFCKEIRSALHQRRSAAKAVQAFLRQYPQQDLPDQLIMLWKEQEYFAQVTHGTAPFPLDPLESLTIGGSGQSYFFERITRRTDEMARMQPDPFVAVALGIDICTSATLKQYLLQLGISDGWGGGFEIATFSRDRFRKIGNIHITPYLWDGNLNSAPLKLSQGPTFGVFYVGHRAIFARGGAIFLVHPVHCDAGSDHSFKRYFDKVDWSVVCVIDKATGKSHTGVRQVLVHKEPWRWEKTDLLIDESYIRQIMKNGLSLYRD